MGKKGLTYVNKREPPVIYLIIVLQNNDIG